MDGTSFKLGLLFQLLDKVSGPAEKIKQAVGSVQEPVKKINSATDKLNTSSSKTAAFFEKARKSVNTLTDSLGKVGKKIKEVAGNSEEIKKKFDSLKDKSMKLTAAGAVITAPFVGFTASAMDFGEGLSNISTMLSMSVGEVREKYGKDILKLAVDIGQTPEQIQEAFYQGLSAGITPEQIISGLYTSGEAAIGGRSSITEAIDGLTTVVNSYGSDVISMQESSDLMFMAVKLGKTTFGELSGSLFNVLPSAAAAGVKFSEITAAIAAVTAQGVPTSVATTKIRAAIDELAKEGTKTSKIFAELSGTSFREFIANGGSLQQALAMLEEHAAANNIGINDLFGSVEAGGAALMLTGKGTEKFVGFLKEMETSAGATRGAFEKMTDEENVKFRWQQFQSSITALSITLGQVLLPTVNRLLTGINGLIAKVQKFTGEHPVMAKNILLPVAALGVMLTLLGTAGMAIGVVGSSIMSFVNTARMLSRVIKGVNLAFLSSPVFWVIAGIVALIIITVLLIKNWDKVKVFLIGMWEKLKGAFGKGFGFIKGLFDRMPGWVKILLVVFIPFLLLPMLILRHWESIKGFFYGLTGFLSGIIGTVKGVVQAGFTWLQQNWQRLVQLFIYLNPVTGPIMAFRRLLEFLRSINLFETGAAILGSLVAGIRSKLLEPVNAVREMAGKIGDLLPHSPAREGPLADLDTTGPGLMDTLAGGIQAAPVLSKLTPVLGSVRDMLNIGGMVPGQMLSPSSPGTMGAAAGSGGMGAGITINITYSPTINSDNPEALQGIVQAHAEDLRRLILETMRGEEEQKQRRSYGSPAR